MSDNAAIGQLRNLTLQVQLARGAVFALGAPAQNTVTVEENDAEWQGMLQTANGMIRDSASALSQTNGRARIRAVVQALTQVTLAENAFTAVAANVPLPALTGSPWFSAPSYIDLHLDAANAPGQLVSPTLVQGTATLVSKVPGRSYLDTAAFGTFDLLKLPTPPATNDVPLTPAQ